MVGLGAGADLARLHLDEVADVHVLREPGCRPDPGVRPDPAVAADLRLRDVAEGLDLRAGGDAHVAEHTVRADAHAVAELDAPLKHAVHVDRHVASADECAAYVDAQGVRESDAGVEKQGGERALEHSLEHGEVGLAVHAERLPRVVRLHRADRHAVGDRERDHVGEVVLLLRVVVPQPIEPAREPRGRQDHQPGVDFGDCALGRARVLLLYDAHDLRAVAHDAAVAGRLVELDGEEPDPLFPRSLHELQEGRVACQGHVPVQDQGGDGTVERGQRLLQCVAGAELRLLADPLDAFRGDGVAHRLPAVPIDDDRPRRSKVASAVQHVGQQRATPERVQHLGQVGAHALALPGCQDDHIHGVEERKSLKKSNVITQYPADCVHYATNRRRSVGLTSGNSLPAASERRMKPWSVSARVSRVG